MGYKLTQTDIAAFRQADRLVVAFNESNPSFRSTTVRLIKEARKTKATPFAEEQTHELEGCPVRIYGSYGLPTATEAAKTCIAFAMIGLYHSQHTHESSIVRQLRAGDDIDFQFYPDRHCNGYVAAAGLHADVLLLHVARGEGKNRKQYEFEIDSTIAPNNSGRMIRGLPETDEYRRNGARTRRENWTPPAHIAEPVE